jgi:quinoprotein glucose dehydrogenase
MFSRKVDFIALGVCLLAVPLRAAELVPMGSNAFPARVAAASDEGERAIKRFRLQKGFKAELFAAEPMLANPVAFTIDEKGRFYVAETFRLHDGVTDIRSHMTWLNDELASTSVEERVRYMKQHEGDRIGEYTRYSDRVRMIWDANNDGKADRATVFTDGYNAIEDGIGAGLLAHHGVVYYANIPNLWILRDEDNDGIADSKRSALRGFGVRVGFLGHDLHGFRIGPDGKLYFTIGDRGAHVVNKEGKVVENHEEGAVYRCDLDGSNFEIFARGLRNPQELAFDEFGNLWTGDNNSDGGDPARWVYVVEGGDSGWRVGFQFLNNPSRGVWLSERMCYPQWEGQAAFIVPPIANIGNGPSGLTYYPGTSLSPRYANHFFLADFRGTTGSGIHSFGVKPRGASFEVVDRHEFIWEVLVTDCEFGYDGNFYLTDWVEGWNKSGKGRIYRITDPEHAKNGVVSEVKQLFGAGIEKLPESRLASLLSHPDMRVRQEAQFAIVHAGPAVAARTFTERLRASTNIFTRIHSIWGLGQISTRSTFATETLNRALLDHHPEVRAQAAKVLGESRRGDVAQLAHLTQDDSARVRFFAAQALGKMYDYTGLKPLIELLRANEDRDPYLRHAAANAIGNILRATNNEPATLAARKSRAVSEASQDESDAVRMGVLLALRHVRSADVAQFLHDANPRIVAEAARAINDLPIEDALPELADLIEETDKILAMPTGDAEHPGPRDAVLRRVLNANFRVGDSNNAFALATFAAATAAPESFKVEALSMLGEWVSPSHRDRITGLWRSLEPRDRDAAGGALQPFLGELQKSKSNAIKLAATRVAGTLNIQGTGIDALDIVKDKTIAPNIRVEALRSLAGHNDARLAEAVGVALSDESEALRQAATAIHAQLQPDEAIPQIGKVLTSGTISEKQTALATLGGMGHSAADALLAQWLDRLMANAVPPELQLDVLDAAARRTNVLVKDALQRFERSRPAADDLRSYRECLVGGNAEEGRKIFFERPEASCVRCHKHSGEGAEVGPDLTLIGSKKDRGYILESLTYPNKQIAAGFENVLVTLKNGTSYAGLIRGENKDTLDINSPEDGVVRVRKADIKTRERGLSGMPEELRQVLTKHDLRDLVEFLATSTGGAAPAPTPAAAVAPSRIPLAQPAPTVSSQIVAPPTNAAPVTPSTSAANPTAEVEAQRKLREMLNQGPSPQTSVPVPSSAPSAPRTPSPAPAELPKPEKKLPPAE